MANPPELNLAAEWGSTPASVTEFFGQEFVSLQDILVRLNARHAIRADTLGNLQDKPQVQDALKEIQHIQDQARMGNFQPARDYITAKLASAVQERAASEQKLRAPKGTLYEDGRYDQFKPQQQAIATELQRFKAAGQDRQFPVLTDAAKQQLTQAKYNVLQTERGLTEDGQRQTVQQEAHLRGLLQSLPRSK